MWVRPRKLKEGFATSGGLLAIGTMLQLGIGAIDWKAFAFPVNVIILTLFIVIALAAHALRHRVYAFRYMSTSDAAVTALAYVVTITAIMGLTRQVPDGQQAADPAGITRMLSFWPFVLTYVWMAFILALVILRRATTFHFRDIPFMLNHLGLLLVLVCATLGSSDMRRLTMTVGHDSPEWRAADAMGNITRLPIAIRLKHFTIDEYPPKLMLLDNKTGLPIPAKKPQTLLLDSTFHGGQLQDWHITLLKKIELAAPIVTGDTTRYVHRPSSGATCAVLVKASSANGRRVKTGWVTCGSYMYPYQLLALDSKESLVMSGREPQRFVSTVDIHTKTGRNIETKIEVNKPFEVDGWNIYQLNYDTQMGRWSDTSTLELVTDPWQPAVYTGIIMMLLGAVYTFVTAQRRKEDER